MVNKKFTLILRKAALLNPQSLQHGQTEKSNLGFQMTFIQLCSAPSIIGIKCQPTMPVQKDSPSPCIIEFLCSSPMWLNWKRGRKHGRISQSFIQCKYMWAITESSLWMLHKSSTRVSQPLTVLHLHRGACQVWITSIYYYFHTWQVCSKDRDGCSFKDFTETTIAWL